MQNDYYPFGMAMPGRTFSTTTQYRYGFNGKENDPSINDGAQDYGMRINDRRLGRFLSVDPLAPKYPFYTPYQFAGNTPIQAIDLDGKEIYYAADGKLIGKHGTSKEMKIFSQNYLDNLKKSNIDIHSIFSFKEAHNDPAYKIMWDDFKGNSQTAYLNTDANQLKTLSNWATKNQNKEAERVMSLFIAKIDYPDGKGQIDVFVEGSTGQGDPYKGKGAMVTPDLSTSFSGWTRSTTIHTHPKDGPKDFSNEVAGFLSGGDLQWSWGTGNDLYLVPPVGNVMGKFSPNNYKKVLRASFEKYDPAYKKWTDAEMFSQGTSLADPINNQPEAKASITTVEFKTNK